MDRTTAINTENQHIIKIPRCIGTGLVALDVIVNGNPNTPAKVCAGGSCGNVLSILSFLGWDSKPIARLADNNATESLCEDLTRFDVNTSLISKSEDGSTPVIIHRILKDKFGNPKHKFEFKVPETGAWLPQFKPVLKISVNSIIEIQPTTEVFFFDRVSRSSLDLARYYKAKGALIVFEPSSIKNDNSYLEALELANITKFSNERVAYFDKDFPEPISDLEIQTLGKDGLKYRLKSSNKNEWTTIPPFLLNEVVDTAGAGDWCTAGIISQLGNSGAKSLLEANQVEIDSALNFGQALGALNCLFFGARGMMYKFDYATVQKYTNELLSKKSVEIKGMDQYKSMTSIDNFSFEKIL
jgi:sugar/nucleoside kinase (ribokinase family)